MAQTTDSSSIHGIAMSHLHPTDSRAGNHTPIPSHFSKEPAATTAFEAAETHDPISRNASHAMSDLEGQRPPRYTRENDPYQLSSALKNQDELQQIAANTSRKRDGFGPIKFNANAQKARKLQKFYEAQNEKIEKMLKPVADHCADAKMEAGQDHLKFQIAVYGSFAANIVLAGLQLYGAISSGSLSLFTTMADSVFDPLSNLMLILSHRAVKKVDPSKFPSGKARLETAGNVFFAFLMIAVSFIIIAFSIQQLAGGSESETHSFNLPSVLAVAVAFCTKFALFLYCWALKDKYSVSAYSKISY